MKVYVAVNHDTGAFAAVFDSIESVLLHNPQETLWYHSGFTRFFLTERPVPLGEKVPANAWRIEVREMNGQKGELTTGRSAS